MKNSDYRDYIGYILTALIDIETFTQGFSLISFKNDRKTIYSVVRCIEIISQAVQIIPRTIKDKHPTIPWMQMSDMCNKLINEDFEPDINYLWQIIKEDVPYLKKYIQSITPETVQ